MSITTLTPQDLRVRNAVLLQLEWDAEVEASAVGVTARNSVVTLTGFVDSYAGKLAAERAAKRVHGVKAVANDIQVRLRLPRTDADIATDAVRVLELHGALPEGVQLVVHNGNVTLTGAVPTLFHRVAAEKALRHLRGLKGVVNRITIVPAVLASDVHHAIARALHRDASLHGRGIEVTVADGTVTLTGQVRSWLERESAERAATHAPGITDVVNQITVAWPDDPLLAIEEECG